MFLISCNPLLYHTLLMSHGCTTLHMSPTEVTMPLFALEILLKCKSKLLKALGTAGEDAR